MNTPHKRMILPRWIRLADGGQERLHEEWLKAGNQECSKEWEWFCLHIVDYREGCSRTNCYQTWRTRTVRALLWLAERVARS